MPVSFLKKKKVGIEFVLFFFHTCIYEKCFVLLSCLIDNLAAFTIIVLKPFTLRILRESLYHLPVLNVVAKKFNAFMFLDAFYVIWFIYFLEIFVSFLFPCFLNLHVDVLWVIYHLLYWDFSMPFLSGK